MSLDIAEGFAEELLGVETDSGLKETLKRVCGRLGFDHFALTFETRTGADTSPEVLLHDYPAEWAKVYITFDLAGKDPVRRACDKSLTGFTWESIDRLVPMTRGDRQMLAVGRECGIGDGYTVPRHLPGLARGSCTFAVRPGGSLPTRWLAVAELVGALALGCAARTSGILRLASNARLSDRQRECLLWTARGKTASETAIILGISEETVVQHLKMARERYGVHCRQSLILSALFDGLIGFGDVIRWPERS
ncbi:MAG: autoinducer binding domain-containing protein [Alphaproteobacteria bacterium]|nr:autoinducer binding domain-containing protein [Alphaproteobacteria bacterium]